MVSGDLRWVPDRLEVQNPLEKQWFLHMDLSKIGSDPDSARPGPIRSDPNRSDPIWTQSIVGGAKINPYPPTPWDRLGIRFGSVLDPFWIRSEPFWVRFELSFD